MGFFEVIVDTICFIADCNKYEHRQSRCAEEGVDISYLKTSSVKNIS